MTLLEFPLKIAPSALGACQEVTFDTAGRTLSRSAQWLGTPFAQSEISSPTSDV
jgi:hypothetical protein